MTKLLDRMMIILDELRADSVNISFNYKYAELKAIYYDKFIMDKDPIAEYFLGNRNEESQKIIQQLKMAYSRSMVAEIELNRSHNENRETMERVSYLQENMDHDSFTGLLNKVALQKQMTQVIASVSSANPQAMVLIDIDFFKQVNDICGHLVGDDMIGAVAQILQKQASKNCLVGRFGGDEFAMYFTEFKSENALRGTFKGIMKKVEQIVVPMELGHTLTLSMGAFILKEENEIRYILGQADKALYTAKHEGRNCYVIRCQENISD